MADTGFTPLFEILDRLEGFDVRLGGGWGIDVLVGRVTRAHHDVDVFVPSHAHQDAVARFEADGFSIVESEPGCRTVLQAAGGRRVDLNGVIYGAGGEGLQVDREGDTEWFPADCWELRPVEGREVRCLTAGAQRDKHTGYPPREVDAADLAALAEVDSGRARAPAPGQATGDTS